MIFFGTVFNGFLKNVFVLLDTYPIFYERTVYKDFYRSIKTNKSYRKEENPTEILLNLT